MKLKCKNMTHAMKANKILYSNGIHSRVEKNNDDPEIKGCVYSIVFDERNLDRVLELIRDEGVTLHKKEKYGFGDAG